MSNDGDDIPTLIAKVRAAYAATQDCRSPHEFALARVALADAAPRLAAECERSNADARLHGTELEIIAAVTTNIEAERDTATKRAEAAERALADRDQLLATRESLYQSHLRRALDAESDRDRMRGLLSKAITDRDALRAIIDGLAPVLERWSVASTLIGAAVYTVELERAWRNACAALAKIDGGGK